MSESQDSEKWAVAEAQSGMWEFWEGGIECLVKGLDVMGHTSNSSTQGVEADGTL